MMFSRIKKALSISQRSGSKSGSSIADQLNMLSSNKKKIRFKGEDDTKVEDFFDPGIPIHYPFDIEKLYRTMEMIVESKMNYMDEDEVKVWCSYEPAKCTNLSQTIATEIKDEIKLLNLTRYRIAVVVSIIQKQFQGINYKMKCCIDPLHDSFANYSYENPNFYIICTAMMVYKD